MTDREIVELYWQRSERAIAESETRHGSACRALAQRILRGGADAEECVSDTWLRAWNAIPPARPDSLRAFLLRLTRNAALDRLRASSAAKRGGEVTAVLDELGEIAGAADASGEVEARELGAAVNAFLRTLNAREADIFIRRCFYAEPVGEIARHCGLRPNAAAVSLSRTRKKLKAYLEREGYL